MLLSGFLIPFFNQRKQVSLEKCLILGLGQESYKMSLDHLTVPKSRKVLNLKTTYTHK